MDRIDAVSRERISVLRTVSVPLVVFIAGGLILLFGVSRAVLVFLGDRSIVVAVFNLILVAIPGAMLMYAGYWVPRSEITPEYYPRIIGWVAGGIAVMFGFIILRDLHPGVTVEWSVGTQAIALMIGSIGGLLIGVQETKATIRTEELEERARALEEQEQHLTRQNERLEQFTNVVSHDLRNPLNVASGRLQLAREDCNSEHLSEVERAHERMEALITDLLALAREGITATDGTAVDLRTLVESCWRNVDTRGAMLRTDVDHTVRADESRLAQLFENLIRNSVEHGASDATVRVGNLEEGFYVEDDGPGIPPDERPAVFEVGHTTSESGTGFGLSIVEQVVEAHGWEISVTEGTDGGARFEITGVDAGTT